MLSKERHIYKIDVERIPFLTAQMASIGEIMAQVAHAEVVSHETTVMYDDELLSDIKYLTVEELYVRLDKELEAIDQKKMDWCPSTGKTPPSKQYEDRMKQLERKDVILNYLCELYRRNLLVQQAPIWLEHDSVKCKGMSRGESDYTKCGYMSPETIRISKYCCEKCYPNDKALSKKESMELHTQTVTEQCWKGFHDMKHYITGQLQTLRKVRDIQLSTIQKPRMYEEINDLMDSILDANGNKISEFKDYLTPEHYRLIRSGIDVKEIKEHDVLLASLRKMKLKGK
jgi:hypothetical protein